MEKNCWWKFIHHQMISNYSIPVVLFVIIIIRLVKYLKRWSFINNKHAFLKEIEHNIVLDQKRRDFVQMTGDILLNLVNNRQANRNRYNRLLLGRKGIGKSRLLEEIENATKRVFPEINIVRISLQSDSKSLPSEAISSLYNKQVSTMQPVINELRDSNKKVLLLIDEFQLLYTSRFESTFAKVFMSQLSMITDCDKGLFYCIVTGSSSVLRSLCFCVTKNFSKDEYPNFCGMDLNSTKLQPYWIYPLLEQEPFERIVSMNQNIKNTEEIDLCNILLSTCAAPGNIKSYPHANDQYTLSLKGKEKHPLFQVLCKQICICNNNEIYSVEKLLSVVSFFDISDLERLWQAENNNAQIPWALDNLFELADKGLIRFENNKISFTHPIQFFEVFKDIYPSRGVYTPIEYAELKYPTKGGEKIAMRMLSEQSESWLGFKSAYQSEYFNIPKDVSIPLNPLNYHKRSYSEFFEKSDCVGIDGVTFYFENNCLDVHRYRIKLGQSSLKEFDMEDLIKLWIGNRDIISDKYKRLFNTKNIKIVYYLITTRPATNKGQFKKFGEELKSNLIDVKIISKNMLATKVWSHYHLADLNPCYGENKLATE